MIVFFTFFFQNGAHGFAQQIFVKTEWMNIVLAFKKITLHLWGQKHIYYEVIILLTSLVPCWQPSGRTQVKFWFSWLLLIYVFLTDSTTFDLTKFLRSLLKYVMEFLFLFCFHVSSFFQNLSKYNNHFNFIHHYAIWI